MDLYGNITTALSSFAGTQKLGFILQRAGAAATAYIHGMAGATAAVAPPPVGLGPIAGLALSKKIALMTKLNVAAILASSFAGAGNAASGIGSGSTTSMPVSGDTGKPKVTVVLQGGMENMLERINEFVEDSDFKLVATSSYSAVQADTLW